MKYKRIKGMDLCLSSICLGTAELGSTVNKIDSFRMLDYYLDCGGNFLDSAHVYANWIPGEKSISEKTIGKWVQSRNNRDKVVIATKGGHPELSSMDVSRLSPDEIIRDLDESLRCLQVDYIDFYWLHRDDPDRPVGEMLETLHQQVKEGKIRYFGCSNWLGSRIQEANNYAEEHGLETFKGSEIQWSLGLLNKQAIQDPTIVVMNDSEYEFYRKNQILLMAFTSQAKGFFTKLDKMGIEQLKESVRHAYYNQENMKRYERAKTLAAQLSTSISAIVLAYLTSRPFPTIPIVGCRSLEQMEDSLEAADMELDPKMINFLETGVV